MSDAGLPVPVRLLTPAARLPERAYEHDAAWDLYAAEEAALPPLHRAVVGTGVAPGAPESTSRRSRCRAPGLAARHGISIVNAPGLIDPGYRGEVRIILLNTDEAAFHVARRRPHRPVALPAAHRRVDLVTTDALDDTHRGERGFGSSGTGER